MSRFDNVRQSLTELYLPLRDDLTMVGINKPLLEDVLHALESLETACRMLNKKDEHLGISPDKLIESSRLWPDRAVFQPQKFGMAARELKEFRAEQAEKETWIPKTISLPPTSF